MKMFAVFYIGILYQLWIILKLRWDARFCHCNEIDDLPLKPIVKQRTLRQKVDELHASVLDYYWDTWELEFISTIYNRFCKNKINLSTRQRQVIEKLWEKL